MTKRNGRGDPDRVEAVSCAVLVGGYSRRLGCDKALIRLDGITLTERVATRLATVSDDVMLVGNRLERFTGAPWRRIADEVEGFAALGGIYSSLLAARHPHVFVAGCDMPFLDTGLVRYLCSLTLGFDVVMPYIRGLPEPMHAVYSRAAIPAIERLITSGERRILRFFPEVRMRAVPEDRLREIDRELNSFFNVNTPEDLRRVGVNPGGPGAADCLRATA